MICAAVRPSKTTDLTVASVVVPSQPWLLSPSFPLHEDEGRSANQRAKSPPRRVNRIFGTTLSGTFRTTESSLLLCYWPSLVPVASVASGA